MSYEVTGDVVAGGSIDIDGLVKGDVVSVGGTVRGRRCRSGRTRRPSAEALTAILQRLGRYTVSTREPIHTPRLRPNSSLLRWDHRKPLDTPLCAGALRLVLARLGSHSSQVANVANAIDTAAPCPSAGSGNPIADRPKHACRSHYRHRYSLGTDHMARFRCC